jgi:hypothetical protein
MYITCKGGLEGDTFFSILQLGSKEVLPLGSAQCLNFFDDEPMNMALSKRKKKKLCAHP